MSQTSAGHPLDLRDSANGAPCPMERLADRMADCPRPFDLKTWTYRNASGDLYFELRGTIQSPDQIDELINYLAMVKG